MSGDDTNGFADARRVIEAVLFASAEPLGRDRLAEYLPAGAPIDAVLDSLAADYAGRGVELVRRDDAWAFRTAPDLAPHLQARVVEPRRLGRAALEVLAIIAYHRQAVGRPLEWVTTPHCLDHFDLTSLADLPGLDELKAAGLLGQGRGIADYAADQEQPALPLEPRPKPSGRLGGFTTGLEGGEDGPDVNND
jgi:segregation and condensation protein B